MGGVAFNLPDDLRSGEFGVASCARFRPVPIKKGGIQLLGREEQAGQEMMRLLLDEPRVENPMGQKPIPIGIQISLKVGIARLGRLKMQNETGRGPDGRGRTQPGGSHPNIRPNRRRATWT